MRRDSTARGRTQWGIVLDGGVQNFGPSRTDLAEPAFLVRVDGPRTSRPSSDGYPEPDGVHYYPIKAEVFTATYDPVAFPPSGRSDADAARR